MRWEYRERFSRHRLKRKPLVSDLGMHPGTCVTHVPWCTPGSPTCGGGENVPGIPGACATPNFTYLARGPLMGSRSHGRAAAGVILHAPSQWEMALHCNTISHWLGAYTQNGPCSCIVLMIHIHFNNLTQKCQHTTTHIAGRCIYLHLNPIIEHNSYVIDFLSDTNIHTKSGIYFREKFSLEWWYNIC